MNTDQLACEVFVVDPGSYFEMIGEPRSEAEVQVMLGLNDYRKSRFYQEARQDGVDEGKAEGKAEVALRMASRDTMRRKSPSWLASTLRRFARSSRRNRRNGSSSP